MNPLNQIAQSVLDLVAALEGDTVADALAIALCTAQQPSRWASRVLAGWAPQHAGHRQLATAAPVV